MSIKILITGVSKGLGFNLCERFIEMGGTVLQDAVEAVQDLTDWLSVRL